MSKRAKEAWKITFIIFGLTALVVAYAFLLTALMSVSAIAGVVALVVSLILGTFLLIYYMGV